MWDNLVMFDYFGASDFCPDKMGSLCWEGSCKSVAIMTTLMVLSKKK